LYTSQTIHVALNDSARELGDETLEDNNSKPDDNKVHVFEHSSKNVQLIVNLSAANHVEDLEEHKEVEYSGEMSRF
jgi:hypothetical protein